MKKTLMSVVMASVLVSGSAFAALDAAGKGDNGASQATLHFSGKVTSSLCQVATDDVKKEIPLGEISASQLKNGTGRGPAQGFTVDLENCDSSLANIDYVIQDANGSQNTKYLLPVSGNESAKGVGVYITKAGGEELTNFKGSQAAAKDGNDALPRQSIALEAYLGTISGAAENDTAPTVTAGLIDATGIMTIKTSTK